MFTVPLPFLVLLRLLAVRWLQILNKGQLNRLVLRHCLGCLTAKLKGKWQMHPRQEVMQREFHTNTRHVPPPGLLIADVVSVMGDVGDL